MRNLFYVRLILANTFKKKLRAGLVIGGIAITSSVMIVFFGISNGLHSLVEHEIRNSEARDVVTVDQRNLQQIKLDEENLSEIASIGGVGQMESSVGLVGNLIYHGIDLSIPVYGITSDYFATSPTKFAGGDATDFDGSDLIVSTKVLDAFGIKENEGVGKSVQLSVTVSQQYSSQLTEESKKTAEEPMNVVAIAEKGDQPIAYIPLESLKTKGVDSVSQVKLRVSDPSKMSEVREAIEQKGFQTSSIQDSIEQLNKIFAVIEKALIVFALVVLFITVSGTFTIISLTLMEEMKQIGFLRVSGLRNRDVKVLFIVQSILLTALGAFAGVLLGVLSGLIVNGLARASTATESFSSDIRVFAVPGPQIALVLVLSVGIGYLVGLFPAKRAVLLKPLEGLKL